MSGKKCSCCLAGGKLHPDRPQPSVQRGKTAQAFSPQIWILQLFFCFICHFFLVSFKICSIGFFNPNKLINLCQTCMATFTLQQPGH